MISFIDYILMIEAKVDDLVAKHPEHEEAIRAYHAADPTPTKKFLPWLVKQHIAGNVTPNDARLHSTLQHFDKVKHTLDNKDHSGYHYNDLANVVGDRVKAKAEQEAKKNAVETIHREPSTGITAQHIKTKEASQDLYGGGAERGGKKGCARGTSWCVSARSGGNLFGQYGHMYTIHDPHDDNAPYAVHPFSNQGSITSRHNDGDRPYKEVVAKNPRIAGAVDKILRHSTKYIDSLLNDTETSWQAIQHPHATPEHIHKALDSDDYMTRELAAAHHNATPANIDKALNGRDANAQEAAIRNPNATHAQIQNVLENGDSGLVHAALRNPNLSPKHINHVLKYGSENQKVTALRHNNVSEENLTNAINDKSMAVRLRAIHHPKANVKHINIALNSDSQDFRDEAREIAKKKGFQI